MVKVTLISIGIVGLILGVSLYPWYATGPMYDTPQQIEITDKIDALYPNGSTIKEGYAKRPYWNYNRSMIRGTALNIKEWDYYATFSKENQFYICATISDLGYGSLIALAFIDLNLNKTIQKDEMKFFTFGKTGLASSSTIDSTVTYSSKELSLNFTRKGEFRYLSLSAPNMILPNGNVGLKADLVAQQSRCWESMNILTSWKENRKCFYLNEKVNNMPTTGNVTMGNNVIELKDGMTVLDWGRGRWTYTNTWYWGSANGYFKGRKVGWNIGYGFSDRTPASENMIFVEGFAYKVGQLTFDIPENIMEPWTIKSDDGRFDMIFKPQVDRASRTNFVLIKSVQDQVFGKYSGTFTLDDGTRVEINDFNGFAERVYNRW